MNQKLLLFLKNISFLAKQSDDELNALAAKAKEVTFRKHAVIITEGDETSSFYIILSGKVKVFGVDNKCRELTLQIQEAGSYFGELALVCHRPVRSATIQAMEQTVCAVLTKVDFINWLNLHPEVAIAMLEVFSEKIVFLTEKVKQMALASAYERLICVLQNLADKEGDISVIHIKPTDEELAKMVGTQRETINRFINGLIEGGYVSKHGKVLRIDKKLPAQY